MTLMDEYFAHVPEYDDYMYLRGYTPEEILYANRRKALKLIEERMQQIQERNEIRKQTSDFVEKTIDQLLDGFNK